eukprot:GHRQ01004421.1.p1 GENE.GHRQ01004421.1~~GHRQ01004421.1.p1  ORF type:complete len:173 (+),score=34.39 GHRQ01004421.1:383-901(+)
MQLATKHTGSAHCKLGDPRRHKILIRSAVRGVLYCSRLHSRVGSASLLLREHSRVGRTKTSVMVKASIAADLWAAILPIVATGEASTLVQFTPVPALLGGLVLGVATVGKFAITGRILGISGALKGFVQGSVTSWRVLFTLGMLGGAYVAAGITPGAFEVLPATFTVSCGGR